MVLLALFTCMVTDRGSREGKAIRSANLSVCFHFIFWNDLPLKVKGQYPARMGVVMQQRGRSDFDPRSNDSFQILMKYSGFVCKLKT